MTMSGYLPIGTVLLLKEGEHRLMVMGYAQKLERDGRVYDYVGCLWPEGYMKAESNIVFNQDMIERVYFLGHQTDGQMVYMEKMKAALETYRKNNP